jgi:large subunit ribosomal protein L21
MYAIIKTGGKQYKAIEGQTLIIDKLPNEEGQEVTFNEVLLISDENNTNIGTPVIASASVTAKVVSQFRDKKIIVFKKRRRHNYRRTQGHRQYLTEVVIEKIVQGA